MPPPRLPEPSQLLGLAATDFKTGFSPLAHPLPDWKKYLHLVREIRKKLKPVMGCQNLELNAISKTGFAPQSCFICTLSVKCQGALGPVQRLMIRRGICQLHRIMCSTISAWGKFLIHSFKSLCKRMRRTIDAEFTLFAWCIVVIFQLLKPKVTIYGLSGVDFNMFNILLIPPMPGGDIKFIECQSHHH